MFRQYDPLNCWIQCTDLYECLGDSKAHVSEIRCSSCGQGNRFRVANFMVPMILKHGSGIGTCQMGRKVYKAKEELCDACRKGGELIKPAGVADMNKVVQAQTEPVVTVEEEKLEPNARELLEKIIQSRVMANRLPSKHEIDAEYENEDEEDE